MRGLCLGIAFGLGPSVALAQPQCAAPVCAPQGGCHLPEAGPVPPQGRYVRSPESGEFAGPAESIGVKGFGIRLPEIRLDFPEIRLPHLVRYRRNPEMIVSESRAPFVAGEAMEFNQVAPEAAPVLQPEAGPVCVPPSPPACSTRERRLLEELAGKEAELQEMNRRFSQLEAAVTRLAEQQSAAVPMEPETDVRPSSYQSSAKTPSHARPLAASRSTPPAPVKRTGSAVPDISKYGLAPAPKTDEFGDWFGTAKR